MQSRLKLFINYLNFEHQVQACKLPGCPKCGKRHNSNFHNKLLPSKALVIDPAFTAEQSVLYMQRPISRKQAYP